MTQPDELKKSEPLVWSSGIGTDVWELFCACIAGDLTAVQRLFSKDPSLARCQHAYRKPLYFAVRENRLAVVEFLLERDKNPIGFAVNNSPLEIARDRGYAEMEALLTTKLAEIHNISLRGEPVAEAIRQRGAFCDICTAAWFGDMNRVRELCDQDPLLANRQSEVVTYSACSGAARIRICSRKASRRAATQCIPPSCVATSRSSNSSSPIRSALR